MKEAKVILSKDFRLVEHIVLANNDIKAVNTEKHTLNVTPRNNGKTDIVEDRAIAMLDNLSWNVIRFRKKYANNHYSFSSPLHMALQ